MHFKPSAGEGLALPTDGFTDSEVMVFDAKNAVFSSFCSS